MTSTAFQKLLDQLIKLKADIDGIKPLDENLNQVLQERLRIEWTYNSNAIEGNTLTLGETSFFLREGLTSEGKPLKDFLEAKNHAEAITALEVVVNEKQHLSEFFVKSLHGVLLKGIDFTLAKGALGKPVKKSLHVGAYKMQPNHVLTASGKIHHYVDPLHVKDEMEKLLVWCNTPGTQEMSVIEKAAIFHYRFVKIHPFDDGNGRLARLLMNVILMQSGFPPCIIKNKNRKKYLTALEQADETGDSSHFLLFIAQELLESMRFICNILSGKESAALDPFQTVNRQERHAMILSVIEKKPLSISQILEKIPHIKRPTIKKDLQVLVEAKQLQSSGRGRGMVYFQK